jgi:hypothetical protein
MDGLPAACAARTPVSEPDRFQCHERRTDRLEEKPLTMGMVVVKPSMQLSLGGRPARDRAEDAERKLSAGAELADTDIGISLAAADLHEA